MTTALQPKFMRTREVKTPKGWPEADTAMFHGVLGDLVRDASDFTEADPAALMASLLTFSAAVIGNQPYLAVSGLKFSPAFFTVLVGHSSHGRKGTSAHVVRIIRDIAVPDLDPSFNRRGFGSGEGLISRLAEAEDRRMLIHEDEFAQLLTVTNREGSTLSAITRMAWDGVPLENNVKGAEMVVSDYHLGILGHITLDELKRTLNPKEVSNGFGNRFLWIASHRRKLVVWDDEIGSDAFMVSRVVGNAKILGKRLGAAKHVDRVKFSDEALDAWADLYEAGCDSASGTSEELSARWEAQLLRLALTFALLDGSTSVEVAHLTAAQAVWNYSAATVKYVFGDSSGDPTADRLQEALKAAGPEGLTFTEIQKSWSGHLSVRNRDNAIALLEEAGTAKLIQRPTGGKPQKVLIAADQSAEPEASDVRKCN